MVDAPESKPARRIFGIALIVAGVLLMSTAASVALAQAPDADSRPAAAVEAQVSSPADDGSDEPSGLRSNLRGLPFTGLDLLILGGLAMVLLGTGMALRRLSAPRVL